MVSPDRLFDATPIPLIICSNDGKVVRVNETAQRMFALPPNLDNLNISQLLNLTTGDLVGPESGKEAVAMTYAGPTPVWLVTTRLDKAGECNLLTLQSISWSNAFQEMKIRLDSYRSRSVLIGDLAHSLNNHLAVLAGNVELLPLLIRKGDNEKITAKLEALRKAVDKLTAFVAGLMEAPHYRDAVSLTDVNQVIENVIAYLTELWRLGTCTLNRELATSLPLVAFDRATLEFVLFHVLSNAFEAVADNEGERRIIIRSAADQQAGTLVVEVLDNGPGVREEKREYLFTQRFTTKRKGHGLGLKLSAEALRLQGGSLSHKRDSDTVFALRIPNSAVSSRRATESVLAQI